jgi:hypothetical protein
MTPTKDLTRLQVGGTRPPRRPEQINEMYEELIDAQGDLMPEGHPPGMRVEE